MSPNGDRLFRNRGDGTFEDVTEAAGVLRRDGRGMGVVAADVDWDGLIDLFVANDLCPNFLFINNGDGSFKDSGELSGAACSGDGENQAGMGVDVEDVDVAHERALEMGLEIVHPITDEPWGVRRFFVRDEGGNVVNVLSHSEVTLQDRAAG